MGRRRTVAAGEPLIWEDDDSLLVANVIDGDMLLEASRASGGTGHVITDEDAWRLQAELARSEGIFCEPAAAVSVAGAVAASSTASLMATRRGVSVCKISNAPNRKTLRSVTAIRARLQLAAVSASNRSSSGR